MTSPTSEADRKGKHAAFFEAYSQFPSQEGEGHIPERGSFKTGFLMGWDAHAERQEIETASCCDANEQEVKRLRAQAERVRGLEREVEFYKGHAERLNEALERLDYVTTYRTAKAAFEKDREGK